MLKFVRFSLSPLLKDASLLFFLGCLLLAVVTSVQTRRERCLLVKTEDEGGVLPDTLRVVTLSGSTTYFQYRGEDMGYEYELVKLYADHIGKPISLQLASSAEAMLMAIDSGYADLCITPQAETQTAKKRFLFVGPREESAMVLVQRRSDSVLRSAAELPGHRITVAAHTRCAYRLHHVDKELGGGVDSTVLYNDTITDEDLIESVAEHRIDLTFADEKLAKLSHTYYRNIDVSVPVGLSQSLSWIVRKDKKTLASSIDEWSRGIPAKESYRMIYKRYFEESKQESGEDACEKGREQGPYKKKAGALSPFDDLFKKEAKRIGWPWQLLASIAYHESRFTADVVGWSGARGLMGIMPATGRIYGAGKADLLNPEVSVRVSVSCLIATKKALGDLPEDESSMKIILAAYNAGVAHLQDAMRLAEKYGCDPHRWEENVEAFLKLKNEPHYYNDPVCKAGYLRGKAVARYAESVMSWYHEHRKVVY
ncbi:MAG: transporter substrate-binding domain-containing protein [Porphyromonas sp.]|nr:transporter substrate-binding domain-containing protein [Porphyromonas sp.]